MKKIISFLILSVTISCLGGEKPNYGYDRIFDKAVADEAWQNATTLSRKMLIVRKHASKNSVVSDPVSDRYVITCYGGPIDLVHFFMLASEVCSGKHEMGPRLYKEWIAEGGPENLNGFNFREPPEAHPDDLPSNALGALFGQELREYDGKKDADLRQAFRNFVGPLIPLPDIIAKEFSHREIVMGLSGDSSPEVRRSRRAWLTASPLVQGKKINAVAQQVLGKRICTEYEGGIAALKTAGFAIRSYKKRDILVYRTKKR